MDDIRYPKQLLDYRPMTWTIVKETNRWIESWDRSRYSVGL